MAKTKADSAPLMEPEPFPPKENAPTATYPDVPDQGALNVSKNGDPSSTPPPAKPKKKARPVSATLQVLAKLDREFQSVPVEQRDFALRYLNSEYGPVAATDEDDEMPF